MELTEPRVRISFKRQTPIPGQNADSGRLRLHTPDHHHEISRAPITVRPQVCYNVDVDALSMLYGTSKCNLEVT